MNLQRVMSNPNAAFTSPEALEASVDFSAAQKAVIFRQWKDQLTKLLIADDEGMLRYDVPMRMRGGENADDLSRVTNIMARLSSEIR